MNKVLKLDLWAAFLMLLVCAFATWSIFMDRGTQTEAENYAAAPGCMAESPASGPGPACQKKPATIIGKEFDGGGRMPDSRYVSLLALDKTKYRPEVGSICYARAAAGQHVTVKVWKGEVTIIYYPDESYQTHSNPNYNMQHQPFMDGVAIFDCLSITGLILAWWISSRRFALKERAKASQPAP